MVEHYDEIAQEIARRTVGRLADIGALSADLSSVEINVIAHRIMTALRQAVEQERESNIAIARFYEVENFRLAGDTILADPLLNGRDHTAVDLSDDLQVSGCIHAAMAHAAANIAQAIEARSGGNSHD